MHKITGRTWALLLVTAVASLHAEEIKCPTTRDVWLSNQGAEADFNMGAAPAIKLKINQEFGIVDFDVSALKGKTIKSAWLYVKAADGHKWGLNGGTDLRYLSVATVGKDWVEGKSGRYAQDSEGHGATFNESSFQKANWGWPGARVVDVTLGNMNTLRFPAELKPHEGWHRSPIDIRAVQALVAEATHGLFLLDGTTEPIMNCKIHARESKSGPYLMVTTGEADAAAPGVVQALTVKPAPNWASAMHGALVISLKVPKDAFAYHIKLNGKPLDRWQIPFPAAEGSTQTFHVLDLEPDAEAKLEVTTVDTAGNRSKPVEAAGKTSPKLSVPEMPAYGFAPKEGEPKALGAAKVWAYPEVTKIDPVNGNVLHEKNAGDFRKKNPVWDGSTGTVRLAAAKGEIISFQVAVEGKAEGVTASISALKGAGEISEKGVKLWRNWYVKNQSEYALPLTGAFGVPMADNKLDGQTVQAITVDYHIPLDAKPGDYTGTVTLASGEAKAELKLAVKVYNTAIPETIFFNPELNCYGGPGQAGSAQWFDSYKIAHYHRCTINRVPYSQSGRTHEDYIPQTGPDGRVSDWSNFDKNLGPLLDGSNFKDNPRASVPVATFYLPHYEGWPLDYRKHYNAGADPASGNQELMCKHHIKAKPIEESLSAEYKKGFSGNVADFAAHAKEKGWTRTAFQMYLNNKGWKGGYALWTLDEPYKDVDWYALNYWGKLFNEGANDPELFTPAWHETYFQKGGVAAMKRDRGTFLYRGDISRLDWQGNLSDGIMTIIYGGANERLHRYRRAAAPAILYTYGGTNGVERSNWESAAWCLRAYAQYQDGVLPWQSLGGEGALQHGDGPGDNGNALIINTGKAGFGHAIASFRIHALRRGAQDCELLRLLQLKQGWSREHIAMLVSQKIPIGSKHKVTDAASAVQFDNLTSQGYLEMKEGVLQLLSK